MKQRIYYTESQKAIMWDRWEKGESLQQIAQLFDRNHSSVQGILAESGGIRPAPRHRSSLALTLAEREEISRALASGHWEGDLLFGDRNSQIATLVERHSRYVMLVKVARQDTETVINALIKNARTLPQELYKSLTWDRGKEMADHTRFTLATDIQIYFCDPQSPWQRVDLTRTRTGYRGSISQRERTSQPTRRPS